MPIKEFKAVVVALSHEAQAILPRMEVQATTRYKKAILYEGTLGSHDCLLLQTGLGPHLAAQGTGFLLNNFKISHLMVTGYCGALSLDLKVGEGVFADKVLQVGDKENFISCAGPWQQDVLAKLKSKKVSIREGPLIQVAEPVGTPEEKERLGQDYGAAGVDMETFSVLKVAQDKGKIASLALRFVVDPLEFDLSNTDSFVDSTGSFQPVPFFKEALRRPKIFLKLPGLERMASQARKNMKKAIQIIFDLEGEDL